MYAKIFVIIFLSMNVTVLSAILINEFTQIDKLRQKILQMDDEKELSFNSDIKEHTLLDLVKKYKNIGDEIDLQLLSNFDQTFDVLSTLWIWARIQSEMRNIDGIYITFRKMQHDLITQHILINNKQWSNFAKTILNDTNASIQPALQRITDFIINQKVFISIYKEVSTQICNTRQSPQQLLYNVYNTIALTQMKGYLMIQFSWNLLKIYKQGSFFEEIKEAKRKYALSASDILHAVKKAMVFASRDIWKCDPREHKLEETYTSLNQVFQGFIVNEVDMNPQGTCKENCDYYIYSKVYGCYQNQFCARQRSCNGKLINCQYIDSDMWVCPSVKNSSRRYDYINYENGMTFGHKKTCSREISKVDSWWRWLFWHCSYCMCYCDDHNSSSDRYFNLRDITSDIGDNKVVTGVQIKKENQIIHIQIQQGKLLSHGNINISTLEWKKIDNYTIADTNVKDGKDYHTIMWEKRAVDLDDLDSPADHLLTGLRFRVVGTHLNLEIQMTPFNFTTGMLNPNKSLWHSHDTTEASEIYDLNGEIQLVKKRTELILNKPDISIKSLTQSKIDSQTNQFLLFTATDLEKDAAQSTVPFIDTQKVVPNPPVPISGAGIYHKGNDGFGGFLALKLITYNFEPHLRSEITSSVSNLEISNDINTT